MCQMRFLPIDIVFCEYFASAVYFLCLYRRLYKNTDIGGIQYGQTDIRSFKGM